MSLVTVSNNSNQSSGNGRAPSSHPGPGGNWPSTTGNKSGGGRGDPRKTYYCKNTRMDVDCWRIADYFQSSKVLSTLQDIERFFPKLSNADRYH